MELSEYERITLLMMRGYGDRVRPFNDVRNIFNATFPDRAPIATSTVFNTVRRFEESGSVNNRLKTGRPQSVINENMQLQIMLKITEDPHNSVRDISRDLQVNKSSVHKVLSENCMKPYKIQLHQELIEDDFDRRLEFCEIMMNRITGNPNFIKNIVFSDEATFMLNGNVNRHNCRYWNDVNPHWFRETHTQHPEKINVWAGLVMDTIIGPFVIEGNLTGQLYEDMLRNHITPAIRNYFGQDVNNCWFQQDGAPAHFSLQVRVLLNDIFPERWIGRRGAIEWPPRSPDLSPLDYFFWGYLKNKVYRTKPNSLHELKQRILNESAGIPREFIRNAVTSFYARTAYCQEVGGGHFEQLL